MIMSNQQRARADLLTALQTVGRRHSTSLILFHHAIAERMGLNPTDHKCLDLIIQRGPLTAGALADLVGLTTGTITAVLDRLERANFIRREADPHDRRKVLLVAVHERFEEGALLFADFLTGLQQILARYTDEELTAILDFMEQSVLLYEAEARNLRANR